MCSDHTVHSGTGTSTLLTPLSSSLSSLLRGEALGPTLRPPSRLVLYLH